MPKLYDDVVEEKKCYYVNMMLRDEKKYNMKNNSWCNQLEWFLAFVVSSYYPLINLSTL